MSLQPATLIRRYKRFLADVRLDSGEELTVHCPNTGAMTGCMEEGARVWLSHSDNARRKYAYTWELIELAGGDRICIHSALANRVVAQALAERRIPELAQYQHSQREARYPDGGEGSRSRADFLLTEPGHCFVEVKSVTLALGAGCGAFPDAVSERARRHLLALQQQVERGHRAVLFFLAMHSGIRQVQPAQHIDPRYTEVLEQVMCAGVEVLAYGCEISVEQGVVLAKALPFAWGD